MASVKTQGCSIGLGDAASPELYPAIGNVTSFSGPSGSRAVIDVTKLSSTGKEKDVGIPDFGQVQLEGFFSSADAVAVDCWDSFIAGSLHNWRILFSDSPATQLDFAGYVLNYSYSAGLDDVVRFSITIEISGAVTDNLV